MSSKTEILKAINRLEKRGTTLPEIPNFRTDRDPVQTFHNSIQANKGHFLDQRELDSFLTKSGFKSVLSLSKHVLLPEEHSIRLPKDPHDLAHLELAILDGQFGVAENGAIWLDDADLSRRALPFITEHLILTLPKNKIFYTLHEAYDHLGETHAGFGVFIAGPSKTADIEQSLVIGAHGAKSLHVVLI